MNKTTTKTKRKKLDFKSLKAAKSEGRLYVGRHEADDVPCEYCGKSNPTHIISACETTEDANYDMELDPLYLNGEPCYLVGSGCLKEILALLEKTSGTIVNKLKK